MYRVTVCLLALPLLVGSQGVSRPDSTTRAGLTSIYHLILEAHDSDGDKRLSKGEVEAMIDLSLFGPQQASSRPEMRVWLVQDYANQDSNRDGYLDLTELLKKPLETFACMDANNDGSLSQPEIRAEMARCDPGPAYIAS